MVAAESMHFRSGGYCAPARCERGPYPSRQVGITSEQRRGRAKEPPSKGLRSN